MTHENPFTPSFGEIPAHLAGRKQIIADFDRAFSSSNRRPELTSLFSGARGVGKTALLSVLSSKACSDGWIAVNTTAFPGMLDDIEIGLRRNARHLIDEPSHKKITGIELTSIGALSFENAKEEKTNWRYRIADILDALQSYGTGVVITVDEVDPQLDEMIELAAVFQHFVRENYKVALLMAGLPHNVSALLSNKTVSFLRRAQHYKLERIVNSDVREALVRTIKENGKEIDKDALDIAVESIDGFPFLMQLVGYKSWDIAGTSKTIEKADVALGVKLAKEDLKERILDATYNDLSPEDIRFAVAMLQDSKETKVSDLVERLGRSSAQVGQYRRRLIDAGIIGERRRGVVGFDLPYFREYLAERRGISLT